MFDTFFVMIYKSISRLFTQQDILYKSVFNRVHNWIFLTKGILCDEEYSMMQFKLIDTPVYIIRSPKKEFLSDMMIDNGNVAIIFIVPKEICFIENDLKKIDMTISYIYKICEYLCSYLERKLCIDKKSSLQEVFYKAPLILTIFIVSQFYHILPEDLNKYIPKKDKVIGEVVNIRKVLDHDLYVLLDNGGIIGFDNLYKKIEE